ncbi:MAG: homeobox domain-containing protein, partial [Piptocephalis tieghemiana]
KRRRRLTPEETRRLTDIFHHQTTKPDAALRQGLAIELRMTPRMVQVWFQNRRAKAKR